MKETWRTEKYRLNQAKDIGFHSKIIRIFSHVSFFFLFTQHNLVISAPSNAIRVRNKMTHITHTHIDIFVRENERTTEENDVKTIFRCVRRQINDSSSRRSIGNSNTNNEIFRKKSAKKNEKRIVETEKRVETRVGIEQGCCMRCLGMVFCVNVFESAFTIGWCHKYYRIIITDQRLLCRHKKETSARQKQQTHTHASNKNAHDKPYTLKNQQ